MKAKQFTNNVQTKLYDIARPKYTKEIFSHTISRVRNKDNFLDIACGTGQLLFPISEHFKKSIGIDISSQQIDMAKKHINNFPDRNILLFVDDVYEIFAKFQNIYIVIYNFYITYECN